jgi:hypothetical protein
VSLLRPGSVQDAAHLRALLATMMPEVRQRTAALRQEIDKARALAAQQRKAQATLIAGRKDLGDRKQALSTLETRQRLAARDVSGSADRESERALALAEQARDLGGLLDTLDKAAGLREKLAHLPGPIIRPDRPEATQASEEEDHTLPPRIWPITFCRSPGAWLPVSARATMARPLAEFRSPCLRARNWSPRAGAGGLCRALSRLWPDHDHRA